MRTGLLEDLFVEIGIAAASHAQPADETEGLSTASWLPGAGSTHKPDGVLLYIDGAAALNVTAGAYIMGMTADNKWRFAAYVNSGNAIDSLIDDTYGYSERFQDLGIYSRLALVAETTQVSTYGFIPIGTIV